jgi:hypothetical protein
MSAAQNIKKAFSLRAKTDYPLVFGILKFVLQLVVTCIQIVYDKFVIY